MKEKEIHLRVTMDQWRYLAEMENQSLYIRDLINKDRLDRLDHNIIDHKIKEHEAEIKQLKALKGSKKVNDGKIHELLNYHAPNYKLNAPMRTEGQRFRFIEKSILPQMKRAGSKATPHEIDELLINWPGD